MGSKPVFISYASQDKDAAENVASFFESRGLKCWIAPRDIPPAADWAESIIDSIDSASSMVLLLSNHSNVSPQVRREVERAVNNGMMIYPLILEQIALSKWMQYYISAHQWFDATDVSLNRKLAELIGSIRSRSEEEDHSDPSDLSRLLEKNLASLSTALDVECNEKEQLLPDERRMIAVLAISTELAGKEIGYAAKSVVSRTVRNLIERYTEFYGGYFDKGTPYGYRCLFGLKHVLEDDCRRALECGISLISALSRVRSTLNSRKLSLDFGLGMASGMIDINEIQEKNPDLHGEALLTAHELSQKASMELLATGTVCSTLRDEYSWEQDSKGVYRLSHLRTSFPRKRSISAKTPFVGRKKELSELITLLEMQDSNAKLNRRGGPMHIAMGIRGKAGIGKSRIVHEFIERNCLDDDHLILRGQTLSFAQPPYWLWTTLIRDLLGIEHGSDFSYQEFLDRLKTVCEDAALLDSAPFLAELLSIESGDDRLNMLDSRAVKLEIGIAVRNLIRVLAAGHRLLIVLEDLHWIDVSDLEILEFLSGNLDTSSPVVFLLIYRSEHEDGTEVQFDLPQEYSITHEIELTEVDEDASTNLIRQLIGGFSDNGLRLIDPEAEKYFIERARGNPFYLEELVLDMIESGTLVERENKWRFSSSVADIFVPDTLAGLLQSRLDRLPESWKGVLQHSSVLGVEFQLKLYRRLAEKLFLGRAQPEVFDGLERKQMLLGEDKSFDKIYAFRHILLHDTAYSSIHNINLKLLHKAAAESIEELQPSESDRISGILMHHYEKAEQYHKAIKWGFRAMKHYMGGEALKLTERLENLIEDQLNREQYLDRLFEILSSREQAQDVLGDREDQQVTIERMKGLAEEAGSDYMMAVALKKQGALARVTGNMELARTELEKALELARKAGNRAFEGIVLGNLGAIETNQGRIEEARSNYEKALEIHREAGDLRSEGIIIGNLGIISKGLGRLEEARSQYDRALEIAEKVGDRRSVADVMSNIGSLLWLQGNLDEAGDYYGMSLEKQYDIGNHRSVGIIQTNLAILRMSQGRMEEAGEHFGQALEIVRESGDRLIEGSILGNLGVLHAEQDEADEALDNYEKALEIHREVGNRTSEGIILGNMANSHYKEGRLCEAREYYEMALEADREVQNRREEGNVLSNFGCLLIDEGKAEKALECYRDASAIISELELERSSFERIEELHDKLLSAGFSNAEISPSEYLKTSEQKTPNHRQDNSGKEPD